MQIIKVIIKVEYIESAKLKDIIIHPLGGVLLRYRRDFEEIKLADLAECIENSNIENKSTVYTTTLNLRLCQPYAALGKNMTFRLTCADGSQYLMGNHTRPYTTVTPGYTMPSKVADKSGPTATVVLHGGRGLMRILD